MKHQKTYLRGRMRGVSCSFRKNENEKRVYCSFYGATREEAEYKAAISLAQEAEEYEISDLTVKDLITEWMLSISENIKESTAPNYRMKAEKHPLVFGLFLFFYKSKLTVSSRYSPLPVLLHEQR